MYVLIRPISNFNKSSLVEWGNRMEGHQLKSAVESKVNHVIDSSNSLIAGIIIETLQKTWSGYFRSDGNGIKIFLSSRMKP